MQLLFLEEGKTNYAAYLLTYRKDTTPILLQKSRKTFWRGASRDIRLLLALRPSPADRHSMNSQP